MTRNDGDRILVIGAGAIGGLVALRLSLAGHNPVIAVRPGRLNGEVYREIRVTFPDESEERTTVQLIDLQDGSARATMVIVAVKAVDAPNALAEAARVVKRGDPIVLLANGLPWWAEAKKSGSNSADLAGHSLVAGSVYHAAERDAVGHIRVAAVRRIVLGPVAGSDQTSSRIACQRLNEAGLCAELTDNVRREIWTKLCANVVTGPLCLLTDRPVSEMLKEPGIDRLARALIDEIAAIALTQGVTVPSQNDIMRSLAEVGSFWPSMVQDVRAGRLPEIEATLSAPLRCAAEVGVSAKTLFETRERIYKALDLRE